MQNNIKRDLKYVRQNINEINDKIEKILSTTDIVNNIYSGGINKVLSAEVGGQLKIQLETSKSECIEFKRRLTEALANKGNVVNPAGV